MAVTRRKPSSGETAGSAEFRSAASARIRAMVDQKVAKRGRRRNAAATRMHLRPWGAETHTPIPLQRSRSRTRFHLYRALLGKCSVCNDNPDHPAKERWERLALTDGRSGANSNCTWPFRADPAAHRHCMPCTVKGTQGLTQSKNEATESGTSHSMLSATAPRVNAT
jgi:hypothetical protein